MKDEKESKAVEALITNAFEDDVRQLREVVEGMSIRQEYGVNIGQEYQLYGVYGNCTMRRYRPYISPMPLSEAMRGDIG